MHDDEKVRSPETQKHTGVVRDVIFKLSEPLSIITCPGVCVYYVYVCSLKLAHLQPLNAREQLARDTIIYAATYLVSSDINKHDLSLASKATLAEAFVTDTLQIFVTRCIA